MERGHVMIVKSKENRKHTNVVLTPQFDIYMKREINDKKEKDGEKKLRCM